MPCLGQLHLHLIVSTAQNVCIAHATGKLVGIRKKQTLGVAAGQSKHTQESMFIDRAKLGNELLVARQNIQHFAQRPTLEQLDVVADHVAGDQSFE